MTTYIFCGTPGSGKSVHMASLIWWRLKLGKPVIANFEINTEVFKGKQVPFVYVDNSQLTPALLEDLARQWFLAGHKFGEGEVSVFLDEAQVIFNTRDWSYNREWITFFTQHRKMGLNVYIVAQSDLMIDKQIRAVLEYKVMHRKVNNVGWFGKLIGMVTFGTPVFVAVTSWYGIKMKLDTEWFVGKKVLYKLYDTYKMFETVRADV